ncbi:hypothetical protein [Tuberibacillus sp. Marseille-P3662]|uniref:hypothetical protein n=1 Tax=Tuberibacillus sp. Marseille-P3662 TaxID=1965358 RepID=UPI001592BC5B|nr:hypothetical protein [Tuberibacillus sp. Marseille-P3662]
MENNMPMQDHMPMPNIPMPNQMPMHPYQGHNVNQPMGDIKSLCQQWMHYHVIAHMRDGSQFDGIMTGMDEEGVNMLVPQALDPEQMNRQYGYDGYGYNGYGYRRRYRRYRPRRFPYDFFRYPFFWLYPYYDGGYGYNGYDWG